MRERSKELEAANAAAVVGGNAGQEDHEEALPSLGAKALTEAFFIFVRRIGPLVNAYDAVHGLITIRDTRDTLTFLACASYALVYQE